MELPASLRKLQEYLGGRVKSVQSNVSVSFRYLTNQPRSVALRLGEIQNCLSLLGGDEPNHANAHVEYLVEFGFRDCAFGLENLEEGRHLP